MSRPQIGACRSWLPVGILLLTVGCADGNSTTVERPEIRLGLDECDHCHMILSEERFAAVVADSVSGERLRFDDLGCLASYLEIFPKTRDSHVWVKTESEWLPATEAVFVFVPDTVTPMGSGLLAYSNALEARAVAGAEAQVYRFPEHFPETIVEAVATHRFDLN
ncbi:MAG: nitrous oxide reductase accessory protein NosL [Thermoanaerobaculia bacterium]|nr:nitrous oxide reductase accessory protein NosL [Thermoanaerobaculia bacterium]